MLTAPDKYTRHVMVLLVWTCILWPGCGEKIEKEIEALPVMPKTPLIITQPEPEKPVVPQQNDRIYIRHILIAYQGAQNAVETITIGKKEALNQAAEIRARVIETPREFAAVAARYSDDRATAARGGLIPPFAAQDVNAAFGKEVLLLKPNEISEVVETPFGFHILRKEQIEEAVIQSILIPYQGAVRAAEWVSRSKNEARELAQNLRDKIIEKKSSFTQLAKRYSRDPWSKWGGYMRGIVYKGSIPHKAMENQAFRLKPGEISEVFQSPLGFHILKRHEIKFRQACQIVVLYGKQRSKAQAKTIIDEAYRELQMKTPFPKVVQKYSDDQNREKSEGFTPLIYRGAWVPKLEEQLFSMPIGPVSKPLELSTCYIIMVRVR